jgi:hypothetical protein
MWGIWWSPEQETRAAVVWHGLPARVGKIHGLEARATTTDFPT